MLNEKKHDSVLYRDNVGLALFSMQGYVFCGRRIVGTGPYQWQCPQGGVDRGETPLEAVYREMHEEIGVPSKLVEVLDEIDEWLYYDFPYPLRGHISGPFIGQKQKWFAMRFRGSEADIRLDLATPEFDAWRWHKLEDIPDLVVPFKHQVYTIVAERFARWAR